MMSYWPPLVAMSVVTFWRRAFSSSVTHSTVMSGFFAVKSSVRPCIRIMSPLFTVAMVSVSACAHPAAAHSAVAPRRARIVTVMVSSLMPVTGICLCGGQIFTHGPSRVNSRFRGSVGKADQRAASRRSAITSLVTSPLTSRPRSAAESAGSFASPTANGRPPPLGRLGQRHGRDAGIELAVEKVPLAVVDPARDLPGRARRDERVHLGRRDESIHDERGALPHLADADQRQVGILRQ